MEKKAKFIIITLLGIILVIGFLCLQVYNSRQVAVSELETIKKEKISLISKVEYALKDGKRLEEKISSLNAELDRAVREKQNLQNKFEFVNREKEELASKLKSSQQSQPRVTMMAPPIVQEKQIQPFSSAQAEAYWAGILKAKTDLELQLEGLREQLKTSQINSEKLQKERDSLELETKSLGREKQDMERQYAYDQKRIQEMIDKLAQELVMVKNDKFQVEDSLKSLRNESDILKRQLKTQDARKANLETQVAQLERQKSEFENKLKIMDGVLKDNLLQIDNFKKQLDEAAQRSRLMAEKAKKETVELAPIIVRPKQEARASNVLLSPKGKVVNVNEESNFVIIDLGEDSDVRMSDTFQVYREDKPIATIEVIQIRDNIAACDIKKETAPIKPGDTVR